MKWDYLAGFIDGEGSIIIKPPRVRIYISNTNKEILNEIKNFLKCGSVFEVKRKMSNTKWKKQYGWTICFHKDVLKILENLKDKLVIKKKLCEQAIEYIKNKRWQRYYLSKEELKKFGNKDSSRKIAKELGVSQFSVLKYMKKHKLR